MSDPIATGETGHAERASLPMSLCQPAEVWFTGYLHPFKFGAEHRVQRGFEAGMSISQMLFEAGFECRSLPFVQVFVSRLDAGEDPTPIPPAFWTRARPKPGVYVWARVVPGKKGKNPLAAILTIAVMAGAAYLSAGVSNALGGGLLGKVVGAVAAGAVPQLGPLLISGPAPGRPL